MRQEVFVRFAEGREFEFLVPADQAMALDAARRWLDDEFVANECVPLRASGKVITADKLLALADTVGPLRFETDAAWAEAFARAAIGAIGKPMVRVDVEASAVTF